MARSKKPKQVIAIASSKVPAAENDSLGYFKLHVSFSFLKYDAAMPWAAAPDGKPYADDIFKNLRGLEGMTWNNVIQASGGRSRGTNSHYIKLEKLSGEARRRAGIIKLNEDELFSLRLQGDVRLWGTIEPNGCFYIIWYDPNHQVYPYTKR